MVIGIIAILAAIVIIAINPARQFAQANNTTRTSGVNAILNAVGQRIADNKGVFAGTVQGTTQVCPALPASATAVFADGSGGIDLSCLVPTYIPTLPEDPQTGGAALGDTGYEIQQVNGRVTASAPDAELGVTISVTR